MVIPTLDAEHELPGLLDKLADQDRPADEIIVIDSSSTDRTQEICQDRGVTLLVVRRADFDHGATRDYALRQSSGDTVVFLTQDAVPERRDFLASVVAPLADERVAVSTGRQLPKADATPMESLVREFNYPATSFVRSSDDVARMGIKAFFSSDVCAAYNKAIYLELGGFEHPIKTNEDMFFAAKALGAGYKVAYTAEATVLHSHNLSLKEQYARNYIQGYEIERHKKLLGDASEVSEGARLVRYVSAQLLRRGRVISWVRFGFDCVARLAGHRAGAKAYLREQAQAQAQDQGR